MAHFNLSLIPGGFKANLKIVIIFGAHHNTTMQCSVLSKSWLRIKLSTKLKAGSRVPFVDACSRLYVRAERYIQVRILRCFMYCTVHTQYTVSAVRLASLLATEVPT